MPSAANIAQIAEEHAQVEQVISNYDHAPAELQETVDLLETIEKDLKVRESEMRKLIEKRKLEHKDLDKLQRSGTKRFFVRMRHGGKEGLERKLEKEEREYIEAAQNEHNENVAISELKAAADTAGLKKADLESQVAIRKEMLQRLIDLYESAFDGPSPDFPEEDAAEDELREAEVHFEHVQARLSHEKNVFNILDQAAKCANQAQSALQSANLAGTYDTFTIGGGIWAQMAEADDLIRAQTLSAQARRLLERARGLQPLVKPVPPGKIVSPEWLNTVFDNLYTDYMFQQKIKQSIESVRSYQQGIYTECAASEERIKSLTHDADEAREFLKSRRRQLVATRREILARVREEGGVRVLSRADAGDSGSIPQLPTYAAQPEEGAKVLAIGEPSIPVPVREEQSSPPQYSPPPSSTSFSLPTHCETPRSLHTSGTPGGSAEVPLVRRYAPPAGPPPRSSPLSSLSDLPTVLSNVSDSSDPPVALPSEGPGGRTDADDTTAARTSSNTSDSDGAPTRNGGRNERRIPFGSNNPYRTVLGPNQ